MMQFKQVGSCRSTPTCRLAAAGSVKNVQAWSCCVENHGESMRPGIGPADGELPEVYTRARAARIQSQALAEQLRAAQHKTAVILQLLHNAQDQAAEIHELWLRLHPGSDRMRYSAHARLQARLKSMPVIEQAKGIIMVQCGWPEDQAFEALRRASQRENMKLRDVAAKIVARTTRLAADETRLAAASTTMPASAELAPA
jgi:hypothetical protein